MKLFKNTKAFFIVSITLTAIMFIASCSASVGGGTTTPSSKTDNGLTYEEGGAINHNDGNAIAYFLCEELCDRDDETVKLVFYPDGKFAIRATILQTMFTDDEGDCELYGQRYDKYRGTYEGDPTKDGVLTVNFTEKSSISYGPEEGTYTSMEEALSQEWHQKVKYKPYENTTADITAIIKDDVVRFSNGPYKYNENWNSGYEFTRTTAEDLGPYSYDGIPRRQNDNRRDKWSIPEGYTSVADSAFKRSSSSESEYYKFLEKVTLPSTIKKIGSSAFYNCTGLTTINIPEGCTEIKSYAFYNCWSLKEITLPKSIKSISSNVFSKESYRTVNGEQEEIPSNLVVRFAEGTTKIPDEIFSTSKQYSLIKSVVIPSSVKIIGKSAFSGFSPSDVELPDGLEEIGDSAFYNSGYSEQEEIDELVLPSSLKKIGQNAFKGWKIKKIVIPEGVEEIGSYAFYNYSYSSDTHLKEVELPSTLKSLGSDAFYYNYLETLKFGGTLFELFSLLKDVSVSSYSNLKIYCGDEDVTAFFTKGLDYNLSNSQWEDEEAGMLLSLKSDKTFTKKTGSKIETGLWSTDTSSSPHKITFYQKGKDAEEYEYEYSYYSDSLTITDLADYKAVKKFSVIEKKVLTTEKWTDNPGLQKENGQFVYYQYYLEKAGGSSSYLEYLDTPVYYKYTDASENTKYEDKYYKSCKNEIENMLNSYQKEYRVYNYTTYDYDYFVFVTSDPQQPQQQEEED